MTTAQDQQSRYPAEFEKWARDRGLISSSHGLTTEWSSLGVALEAWQAARALPAGAGPLCYLRPATATTPARAWQAWENDGTAQPVYTAVQVLAMGRVTPGWQAVPVEPTRPMMDAMHSSHAMPVCYRAALAAAPRPPAAQKRKPLTDEQIVKLAYDDCQICADGDGIFQFARAVEAAHGITHPTGD